MNAEIKTSEIAERSPLIYARTIGLLEVIALICGSFSIYVQSKLIVPQNATKTIHNIIASESLFRLSIMSALVV